MRMVHLRKATQKAAIIFCALTIALSATSSFAQSKKRSKKKRKSRSALVVRTERDYNIEGLSFSGEEFKVQKGSKRGKRVRYIRIKGKFKRKGWALRFKKKTIVKRRSKKRKFSIKIPVKRKEFKLVLTAYGPKRKKEVETIFMKVEKKRNEEVQAVERDRESKRDILKARNEKSWFLTIGLGGTILSYSETSVPDYSGIMLTPKIGASFMFGKKWELAVNAYYNVLAISNSPTDSSIKFFGANGRIGYRVISKPRFSLTLSAGLYFITSSASSDTLLAQTGSGEFGFQSLLGMQFYPSLNFGLSDRNSLVFYGKYSPILGLGLGDRELAFGLHFVHKLRNNNRVSFGLDYADITFALTTGNVSSSAINISTAYSF